jgi:hypothetical protein
LLPGIIVFLFVIKAHGNSETAQIIWESWRSVLNVEIPDFSTNNSIGAIGWETKDTFKMHFTNNFLIVDRGIWSLLNWIIVFPLVYYISTNILMVFRKSPEIYEENDKRNLSSIFIFQLICLSPVFTILSIDYIRLFFYLTTSAFAIFLIIPTDILNNLFPKFLYNISDKINDKIKWLIPLSKTSIILIALVLGVSSYAFDIERTYMSSMLYQILYILSKSLSFIREGILSIL